MRPARVAVLLALGSVVASTARPATAQDDVGAEAARELYKQGLTCYERDDLGCAIAAWRAALQELGPERGFRIHYNLGLALEASGDDAAAVDALESFLAAVSRQEEALGPSLEERRQDAAERVRRLRARGIAPPTATPPPAPPAPAPPAPSELRASSPQVARAPAPPRGAPPREAASFPTAWVLAGAGLTGLSLALPLTLRGAAADRREEALALGVGHSGYPAAVDVYEEARTASDVAWALPVTLGLATVTVATVGVVWILTDDGGHAEASVSPGGLSLTRRF